MMQEISWQRVRVPGIKGDCTVTELTDATISLRESGSDRVVTIRRDRIEKFVPADNIKYGGMVKCWTLRLVQ